MHVRGFRSDFPSCLIDAYGELKLMKVCFYNTYNLVVPLLDRLLPTLVAQGVESQAYVCSKQYRAGMSTDASEYFQRVHVPALLAKSKMLVNLWYFLRATLHLLFARTDLNIFFTQPPFFFILGGILSRLRRRPYAVHVMDLHPDMLGRLGLLREDSLFYRALAFAATNALRRALFVVVLGECMKRHLVEKGIAPERIRVIRNLPTVERGREVAEDSESDTSASFTVLYAGNMGRPHEFDTILRAARELSIVEPAVQFRFVGTGARRVEIEAATKGGELPNVELSPSLPLGDFRCALAEASLHFVSLRPGFEGVLFPSKFFSSVAMGKPVLFEGPAACDIARDIEQNGFGAVVAHGDVAGLITAIRSYYERRAELPMEERRIAASYKEVYEKCDTINEYAELIENSIYGKR